MTAAPALALAFGLAVGTWIGAALRGTQARRLTAQRDDAELRATVQAGSADQLYADNQRLHRRLDGARAALRRAINNRPQRSEAS